MRRMALALTVCGLIPVTAPTAAAEDLGNAPGFQAESVSFREGGEPSRRVQVHMGPEGRRLEGIPPRGITLIAPADGDQRWLVDGQEKVYAMDKTRGKGGSLGGVLAHQPCKGFSDAQRLGPATINGRDTVKWKCSHPAFGKVTQWFDPAINTVIRDRTGRGEVQELRNIQVGDQDPALFRFSGDGEFEQVPIIQLFQPERAS